MILRYSPTGIGPYGGDYPDERPSTRGECLSSPRPCPFVSCRYHLAIDAHRDTEGKPRLRVLHEDPTEMVNTCALDVADGLCHLPDAEGVAHEPHEEAAEVTLSEIATMCSISIERTRKTVEAVQKKLRQASAQELEDYHLSSRDDREIVPSAKAKAQGVIMSELCKGDRTYEDLLAACVAAGVPTSSAKWAIS